MYQKTNRHGFTIVELMFAMAFVAVLLLAIAATVMQMSTIYNRGITLKEVNQSGRTVLDLLTRDIAAATPFNVDPDDATSSYVVTSAGGRLCLGNYTYAWTNPAILNNSDSASPLTTLNGDENGVRLLRFADAGGAYCSAINRVPRDVPTSVQGVDLLANGARDLVVQSFSIEQASTSPLSTLYAVTLRLGVNDADLITTTDGRRECQPPASAGGDNASSYCAINEFSTVVRAGNRE